MPLPNYTTNKWFLPTQCMRRYNTLYDLTIDMLLF